MKNGALRNTSRRRSWPCNLHRHSNNTTGNMTTAALLSRDNKNAASDNAYQRQRPSSSNRRYHRIATANQNMDNVFFCSLIQAAVATLTG